MKATFALLSTLSLAGLVSADKPTPCHAQVTITVAPPHGRCHIPFCPVTTPKPVICPDHIQLITVPCSCPTWTVVKTQCPGCGPTPCPADFELVHPKTGCHGCW